MAISNLTIASNQQIITALSNLKSGFNSRNAWIDPNNKYIVDSVKKIQGEFPKGCAAKKNQEIIDYIASSVSIHSYNGWMYLTNALNLLLDGDFAGAIHNAYYAELRALMSFLAAQGIGVFDIANIIVDSNGNLHRAVCNFKESRTHSFAKIALEEWLNINSNIDQLFENIVIDGHSLKNWLDATIYPTSKLPGSLTKSLIESWSFDISVLEHETTFRNFVSYRPQVFDYNFSRLSDNITKRLTFINDVWNICSPAKRFDKTILRKSLEVLYRKPIDEVKDLDPIFKNLGADPNLFTNKNLKEFIKRSTEPFDSDLFQYAQQLKPSIYPLESDTEPMGIISRACLLLLITTKTNESLLRQSATSKADLKFWFDNIGIKSGYWQESNEPILFSDLWIDIKNEMNITDAWLNDQTTDHSNYNFSKTTRQQMINMSQLNKSYLWGIVA